MTGDHEVADKNRKFFDGFAKHYDEEDWVKDLTVRFSKDLQESAKWIGVPWAKAGDDRQVKMLDFACGPGMASNAFYDYVTVTRGIDISSGMIDEYNSRAAAKGISHERMHAVRGNILADPPEPELNNAELVDADFAAICWALHHMHDPGLTLKKLAERLKPGGVLLVLDWKPDADDHQGHGHAHGHGHDHSHGKDGGRGEHQHQHSSWQESGFGPESKEWEKDAVKTVAHHGFSEEQMKQLMVEAGLKDVQLKLTKEPFRFGRGEKKGVARTAFMCRGVRS